MHYLKKLTTKSDKLTDIDSSKNVDSSILGLKNRGLKQIEIQKILKIFSNQVDKAYRDKDEQIPASIFTKSKLSCLETILKYLRENREYTFTEIAKLLGRNNIAIGNSYRVANKKSKKPIIATDSKFFIPCSLFKNRKLSILENIVSYLKNLDQTNHQIALLLNRNDRTIWTVYNRAKIKGIKK